MKGHERNFRKTYSLVILEGSVTDDECDGNDDYMTALPAILSVATAVRKREPKRAHVPISHYQVVNMKLKTKFLKPVPWLRHG
mgnify:CR=1 FL=1